MRHFLMFFTFVCLYLKTVTEISCVIYECKWRKIRDVLELEMMIAGQVRKWEEFFAFFFIICTSFLSANVQIGGGQALHEEELKNGIWKFWVGGHCMWGRCKTFQKSPLVLACQINQTERQIEIHHIDIWRDMGDF